MSSETSPLLEIGEVIGEVVNAATAEIHSIKASAIETIQDFSGAIDDGGEEDIENSPTEILDEDLGLATLLMRSISADDGHEAFDCACILRTPSVAE
jgi:hypothetical protein